MSAVAVIVIVVVVVLLIAMLVAPIRRSSRQRRLADTQGHREDVGPHRSHAEQSRSSEAALADERAKRA